MDKSAIERACDAIGGQVKLAEAVGVSPQAVNQWVSKSRVPPERVLDVEAATGISRHDLRPDIYPRSAAVLGFTPAADTAR